MAPARTQMQAGDEMSDIVGVDFLSLLQFLLSPSLSVRLSLASSSFFFLFRLFFFYIKITKSA